MVVSQDTTLNFIAFSTNALYPSNSNTRVREFTSCNPDMFEPNQNIFEAGLNYNGTVYGQNNYNSFNQIIGSHEKEVPKTRLNLDSAADVDMFAVDLNPGEKISICVEMYCSKDISDEYVIGVLSDCEVYSDVFNNEGNRELCSTCDLYLCESFAAEESQTQQTRYATWVAQHTSGTKRYYIAVGKYGIDFEIGNRIDYDLTVTKVEKSEWNDYNEEQQAWLTDGREVTLTNDFIILNSEISAESISNNQVQSGAIDNQLDIDWFHYKPEIDEIKTFVLEGYPMMILYSNEQILAKDRSISYYLNQGQDYFIGVYCPDGYYNNDNNEIKIKNNPNYTLKVESGTGNNNVLNFTPKSGGKFIYSSNPERIDEEYLAESGNMLDNYENLSPGKYTYMAWYHNGTSSPIYTDVLFNSNSAQIRINKLGLQVFPSRESPRWTGIQAYSDFIGKTIDNSLETHPYNPSACYPTELDLPKTYDINTNVQSRWLSDIYYDAYGEYYPDMENYNEPIYIIMEFEVLSGSPSLSTIAYKTTSDKTQFMLYNAPYIQDVTVATYTSGSPTWKGFADYKPIVETNLSHTIEASVNTDGYSIPMVVQNTFGTITTSNWVTNLNPQNDVSAYPYIAESSMLAFDYIDERNWKFDTKHTSMKNIPEGYIGSNFIPNDTLPYLTLPPGEIIPDGEYVGFKKQQISISQGNYSVENVYNIAVTNNTNSTWKFNYKTTSKSGIVVGISADGDEMLYSCSGSFDDPNDSAVKNGRYVGRTVSIPAQSTVNITVSVVLTTGDAGWINNEFYVSKEY
ncbi:MAG: hypothetical protein MRZ66_07150 [Clostridiales bacterium]|nr:hypothetical protein [Clostridiales bacterium]